MTSEPSCGESAAAQHEAAPLSGVSRKGGHDGRKPTRARQIPRRLPHLSRTGLARLSYDQARDLLDIASAEHGPGTGWDLHELRHSGLTHLGESGASLLELMAKSRHRKAENLRRDFKPSPQAMRELTSLIGPGASHTH
ncbi:hypothetical protein [Nocardia colli]|uniref:hypothetical protein n=1 Tax=Nocardia colli TaxID=2545717 RepID=UPI001CC52B07|nr:hypothetical protein [Nocardia colli]